MQRDQLSNALVQRRNLLAGAAGLVAATPLLARAQPASSAAADQQPIIDVPGAQRNPIPIAVTRLNFFLPSLRRKLRMAMVTSPKSIFTGQGLTQR